jgi:carboxypeptidase Q
VVYTPGMAGAMSRLTLATLAILAAAPGIGGCSKPGPNTVWAQPMGSMPALPSSEDAPTVDAPVSPRAEPPPVLEKKYIDAARKLTAFAEEDTRAWDRLAFMADTFGHRLSGSAALEKAIDWSLEIMGEDGLANVRREPVMVPHWVRGHEAAKILGPVERDLPVLGLGMTVGTPRGGITAEVVVVANLDELDERAAELKGKIVVINQAMPDYDHEHHDAHYGSTVRIRAHGPSRAAAHGAKAVLIRSVTANSLRTLHTGMLSYDESQPKIPAAAITLEDAEWFARMAARGQTMKVKLELGAKTLPDAKSGNAIAEIPGREKPEEIVVIGGHIDSWDVGDGSSDDGSGCLMAMEAATMLLELGLIPKRTIRVVLFTNEENGLRGAKAYHEAHKHEPHVAGIEADSGSASPWGFGVGSNQGQLDALLPYAPLFEGLGAHNFALGGGGADLSPFTREGMLGIAVRPDTSHYFDLHHSPADTIDKIAPYHLERNAAAMALMAYILAERDLPEPAPE